MKKFSIPGYFNFSYECYELLELYKAHPEYFYDDRVIDSSYDFPAGLIWNGGRVKFCMGGYAPDELDGLMKYYFNDTNIKLNHTCTNLLINDELAKDYMCNLFMKRYYREQDSVIIASQALQKHLYELFPSMKFIFSTTLGITEPIVVNNITKDGVICVLNYNKNNNNEYLKQLEHPELIEVICAEPCVSECAHRSEHYHLISERQLWIGDFTVKETCPYNASISNFVQIQSRPHAITNERINELYDMGFQYFKISGRSISSKLWIEIMTYYLVKPEYRENIGLLLINKMKEYGRIDD